MAKIENEPEKAPARHVFEVLVSFDSLNKGETFPHEPDSWTHHGAAMGYLRDLGEEVTDVGGEVDQG
jgi:hypothetical protein